MPQGCINQKGTFSCSVLGVVFYPQKIYMTKALQSVYYKSNKEFNPRLWDSKYLQCPNISIKYEHNVELNDCASQNVE